VVALLLVAVSVGLGNFGAAAALGVSGAASGMRLRIAAVFGLFEAAMPLVGLAIGRTAAGGLGGHAGLVAGVVLCLAGGYTLIESVRSTDRHDGDDGSGLSASGPSFRRVLVLGAALSLDNLAVGFALGAYHVNALVAALAIGLVSVGLTLLGLELGSRLGTRLGPWAERVGGLLLVAVGVAVASGV
jgi:manganese efflux pump family protein